MMPDRDAHPARRLSDGAREAPEWPSADLRTDRPTPARVYDYLLGGKDNYEVDREAAEYIVATVGRVMARDVVWENRGFLQRAVRFLAEEGIEQFIDIGCGLPTRGNVHEIAHSVTPDARVVYVDNDPIVLAHGRALLDTSPNTTVITADMREPEHILAHPDLQALIDFGRPVAVLFIAVFHHITDDENPAGVIRAVRDHPLPSGSYIALSHLTSDGPPIEQLADAEAAFSQATSPVVFRSRAAIASLFDGFDLLDPGLVRPSQWHPHLVTGQEMASPQTDKLYAGVGRLPD